jgi:DNA-binding NarL/FixJ family response regulator
MMQLGYQPTETYLSSGMSLLPHQQSIDRFVSAVRELVALIAQGKSNAEIAEALVLTKRTVEAHIGNILSKLGFTTRAQIIARVWEREHQSPDP